MATSPEQMLISAVLIAQDHVTPAARGITTEFFHAYPDEWEWIERYIKRHRRAPSRAAFKNKFPHFLIKKADDVEFYCEEVLNSHMRARMTESLQDVIGLIEDGNMGRALKAMHSSALSIEGQLSGISGDGDVFRDYQDIYNEFIRRHQRTNATGQSGIPTGFPTLDERTGGPQPGHFWIVAARLGQGKTWSLTRFACAAAFAGFTGQYNALEGTRPEIAFRVHTFASSEYGQQVFKNLSLTQGREISPRDYKNFLNSLKGTIPGKLHIADTSKGPITPLAMAAQIERNRPDAIFLDYITLMDVDGDGAQGFARLSKEIKNIANRYQVPIIAAAQLNRLAAGLGKKNVGEPENLAESDAFGRDADAVILMKQMSAHVVMMKLAKFRHGRDGFHWYTKFLPNTGHFEEITFDEAQDLIADDESEDESFSDATFKPRQKGSFKQMAENRKEALARRNRNRNGATKRKVVVRKK